MAAKSKGYTLKEYFAYKSKKVSFYQNLQAKRGLYYRILKAKKAR